MNEAVLLLSRVESNPRPNSNRISIDMHNRPKINAIFDLIDHSPNFMLQMAMIGNKL